jgi:hypothetical protein
MAIALVEDETAGLEGAAGFLSEARSTDLDRGH